MADTTGFVAGQSIQEVTSGAAAIYIAGIDRTANVIYLSGIPNAAPATININAMTAGTTSQALKGLTLAAAAATTSTIDFGTTGGVVLTINTAPVQTNDGSILSIANWSGNVNTGLGTDQLVFLGAPINFTNVFAQNEVFFVGYGEGYEILDRGGSYEVIAIPEPSTLAMLALGAMGLLAISRRRR